MVGSSDSIADANITLNAIVAEALCQAADVLEQADDFHTACSNLIHRQLADHQRIIFNGNGYAPDWADEAVRRGLPNLVSMVDAIPALTTDKAEALFTKFGIYTKSELEARAEIMYENYVKTIKIEAQTMIHMAGKHYIPSAIHFNTRLGQSINAVASACADADLSVQKDLLVRCSALLAQTAKALEELKALVPQVDAMDDVEAMANAYRSQILPAMDALRRPWTSRSCWWIRTCGPCPPTATSCSRCDPIFSGSVRGPAPLHPARGLSRPHGRRRSALSFSDLGATQDFPDMV